MLCFFLKTTAQQNDPLLQILNQELKREMEVLKKSSVPAYYLDYYVTEIESGFHMASFGSLIRSNSEKNRVLSLRVKVGDYDFDNTHTVYDKEMNFLPQRGGFGPSMLPIENDALPIQFYLWKATDAEYKQAIETYKAVKNAVARETGNKNPKVADFSKEEPETFYEPPSPAIATVYDKALWEKKIKKLSGIFLKNAHIIEGDITLNVTKDRRYFVSSEGTSVVQNFTSAYLNIQGSIRADDGDVIPLHLSYYAPSPSGFPNEDKLAEDIEKMLATLGKLRDAPLAEPYSGPAILTAQTAGVFFHEIFGHRIEGHRLKNEYDGQTFKSRINEQVLPKTLNVVFDPTLTNFKENPLNGAFKYDDEGVKSRRVNVVEKGILKTFLMSRSPLENFPKSNGHGRASVGLEPVSRQSNLIVESTKPVSTDDLRKMLIKECQRQGKPYGYLFKEVVGGFTTTDRYNPNAFNIFPTEVYRVFANGKPDELVRGVDLIGTPLAMFAEIQAAANDSGVFIGFCGAESGNVPVSAVAPSVFVRRIETQKKPRQHEGSTLLPRPASNEQ